MAVTIWTGVAFWLGLNVAFAAMRLHLTRPVRVIARTSGVPVLRLVR
jgi:hypothetical protein